MRIQELGNGNEGIRNWRIRNDNVLYFLISEFFVK